MATETVQKAGKAVSDFCKGFLGSTGGGCCGLEMPKKELDALKEAKSGGKKKEQK